MALDVCGNTHISRLLVTFSKTITTAENTSKGVKIKILLNLISSHFEDFWVSKAFGKVKILWSYYWIYRLIDFLFTVIKTVNPSVLSITLLRMDQNQLNFCQCKFDK